VQDGNRCPLFLALSDRDELERGRVENRVLRVGVWIIQYLIEAIEDCLPLPALTLEAAGCGLGMADDSPLRPATDLQDLSGDHFCLSLGSSIGPEFRVHRQSP